MTLGEAALAYADMGWKVIPLHGVEAGQCSCGKSDCKPAGKHPRTRHGLNDATTDPDKITEWWGELPEANVGIATGPESGIVVLDVDAGDGNDGLLSLEHLEDEHGPLPETVQSYTGGGGRHFFFRHPGTPIGTRAGVFPGIDIRGDGGYVVAPPSIHRSGASYDFEASSSPDDVPLADLPDWIKDVATRPRFGVTPRPSGGAGGSIIPKGRRNDTLTRIAGTIRGQGCDPETIYAGIASVNQSGCVPPLEDADVRRIAQSIGRRPASRASFTGGTYWPREVENMLWDHREELRLFRYLVREATWQDRSGQFDGLGMGQIDTSYRKIADACGWLRNNERKKWSTSTVDRLLSRLEKRGWIEVRVMGHGTLITIVDYRQFKGFPAQSIGGLEQH